MANTTEDNTRLFNIDRNSCSVAEPNSFDYVPLESQSPTEQSHLIENQFDYSARNRLVIACILCIIFMAIEIIGGVISNSTAVITDAAHMCVDAGSFLISLAALYLGQKCPTKNLSYGYMRAEVLGALASILTLWIATGILVYMAVGRCIDQSFQVRPTEMLVVASCGVIFSIVIFFILHLNMCHNLSSYHGHSHAHGHNHSYAHESSINNNTSVSHNMEQGSQPTNSSKNINIRAAIIHIIGDFIQSLGVLAAAILIKINPEYKLADPICTFMFSILVIITTFSIMRDIILVLMEGVPSNVSLIDIINDLHKISGVRIAHKLHVWSLSMEKAVASVHIAINRESDYLKVLHEAQEVFHGKYAIKNTTIQMEPYNKETMITE